MEDTQDRQRGSTDPSGDRPPTYMRLVGHPALTVARCAERAARRYKEYLQTCLGRKVPERKVEAFEAGHAAGQRWAGETDTYATGFKAGVEDVQRARTAEVNR